MEFQQNTRKGRILALDLGKKRIGLAISDPLGITAQGLPNLVRTNKRADLPPVPPGFHEALLFADPAGGQLISQTAWSDAAARAANPSIAEMIRGEVLDQENWQIRAEEDYRLAFDSAWKPGLAGW